MNTLEVYLQGAAVAYAASLFFVFLLIFGGVVISALRERGKR